MKATLVRVAVGVLWAGSVLVPAPLGAAASDYQVAKWEAGPAALPGGRYAFGTVHIPAPLNSTSRGHVMVAGGNNGGGFVDSVYLYSVDAATWSASTKMPVARGYFGIAYIPSQDGGGGSHVMVAGGLGVGSKRLDSVYLYSVDSATWSASTAMPVACYSLRMTYIPAQDGGGGGQVMVAGGDAGGEKQWLDSVYLYNVDSATESISMSASTKMPVGRRNFGMTYIPAQDGGGGGK